jgi:hypothetical protein
MIDVVNHYAERRKYWVSVRLQPSVGGGLREVGDEVELWAGNVRRNIPELENEIADLLIEIRKYLDRG